MEDDVRATTQIINWTRTKRQSSILHHKKRVDIHTSATILTWDLNANRVG